MKSRAECGQKSERGATGNPDEAYLTGRAPSHKAMAHRPNARRSAAAEAMAGHGEQAERSLPGL
jgi:hypothetical protein